MCVCEEGGKEKCAPLLKYFCRHVYCFHAIVHAFVASPHLSDECSFFLVALFGSFLYCWFHPLRVSGTIKFNCVRMCVYVDFLLKIAHNSNI